MEAVGAVMRDLKHAVRQLRRSPGFSAAAIVTLSLGIGGTTAIVTAARAALRPSVPLHEPERLVRVYQVPEAGSPRISPRVPAFLAVREGTGAFERIAASRFTGFDLTTADGPRRITGNAVTARWVETLGVRAALGRGFTPDEEAAGSSASVVLLSHGLWQELFGGDSGAIGRSIRLNGGPHTVVGVMPPGFRFPYGAEVWVPLRPGGDGDGFWALNIQARLRAGTTVEGARAELAALTERLGGRVPGLGPDMTLTAVPTLDWLVGERADTTVVLLGAVGFLLLLVCANLANLLLSRGLARRHEFAVRASLGASRGRLVGQSLAESLALGLAGGAGGLAVAYVGVGAATPLLSSDLSDLGQTVAMDGGALGFAAAVCVATGLLVGLLVVLRLSFPDPAAVLRGAGARGGGGRNRRRVGRGLVVAELAISLLLLAGVGLLVRDFRERAGRDPGYDPEGVLVFTVALDRAPYDAAPARISFAERALRELGAEAGIARAGATSLFPREGGNELATVETARQDVPEGERPRVNHRLADPGFLSMLGVPLLRGRWLSDADGPRAPPVVLVSRSLAARLWPGANPLGRRVRNARDGPDAPWMTVVGVVGDVWQADDLEHTWYVPYAQHAEGRRGSQLVFAARGAGAEPPTLRAIRAALDRVDPDVPIHDAVTARAVNARAVEGERNAAWLGGAFAAFGLLLAALGLYGSVSYSVVRRRREIGIRLALGSDRRRVLRSVLGEATRLLATGGALGLVGAWLLARILQARLAGLGGLDPGAFAAAAALLAVTGLAAGLLPALRATRVDPLAVLRQE